MKNGGGVIVVKFTEEQLNQVRQFSTTEGFCKAFDSNLIVSKTFNEAYELTESNHEDIFGRRKYSCYQAFYHARKNTLEKKNG